MPAPIIRGGSPSVEYHTRGEKEMIDQQDLNALRPCFCGAGTSRIKLAYLVLPEDAEYWGLYCAECGRKTYAKHPHYEDAAKQWDTNIKEDEDAGVERIKTPPRVNVMCMAKFKNEVDAQENFEFCATYGPDDEPFTAKAAMIARLLDVVPCECVDDFYYNKEDGVLFIQYDTSYEKIEIYENFPDSTDKALRAVVDKVAERLGRSATLLYSWPPTFKNSGGKVGCLLS